MNSKEALRTIWLQNGIVNERNAESIREWLKSHSYQVRIPTFLHHQTYKKAHAKALKEIRKIIAFKK